jgi:hypothetical protein
MGDAALTEASVALRRTHFRCCSYYSFLAEVCLGQLKIETEAGVGLNIDSTAKVNVTL